MDNLSRLYIAIKKTKMYYKEMLYFRETFEALKSNDLNFVIKYKSSSVRC